MGITALTGPSVTFGLTRTASGGVQEYNEERGPNHCDCWGNLADPRAPYTYRPGSGVGTNIYGWWGGDGMIDAMPTTLSCNGIALSQVPTAGTALTLSTINTNNATIGVSLIPATGTTAVTVVAIDSTYSAFPNGLEYGQSGTIASWNPTNLLSRQITIGRATGSDDTSATYTIQGFDSYGYAMTETITGTSSTGNSTYASRKAFKYIRSITPGGTLGATGVYVGVNDTYGFPLAVHDGSQVEVWSGLSSNGNWLSAQSSLMVFASTITQTATTADVRGTWASSIASSTATGQRVKIVVHPRAQDMQLMTTTYLTSGPHMWLGVDHYSS